MGEWKEYKLSEIATIVDCEHKTAPLVEESEYISVRTTDVKNGRIDFENANRVSLKTYLEGLNGWFRVKVILFSQGKHLLAKWAMYLRKKKFVLANEQFL